ncbi:MAG: PAS domain-containing sensor histidine kinase [Nitriliruptor sp.]|uniref:sensor histidine kinase n=1 Tax=Nitriliruptor sp. TaxID=2448056 RepID=UPI0034A055F6
MDTWDDDAAVATSVLISSPLPTIVLDEDRVVRRFNPAAERLTARDATDVIGCHVADLFLPDERTTSVASLEAAARGETGHLELGLACADGRRVPLGISWAPLVVDGLTVGLVGVGCDITTRKALQHELATMAASFRALASGTDLAMYRFGFDPTMRVDYVNPSFERGMGVSLDQLTNDPSPLWKRLDPDARDGLARSRKGEDVTWPIEGRFEHPDGHTLDIQLYEVPLRNIHGELEWVLGIAQDVTDRRRQERALASALELERAAATRLRRVDELRQVFLQAVSHELRTPLTAILGFAAILRDHGGEMPPTHARTLADRIHRQGLRIQRLLDDLLDVDRLSRGVLTLERVRTDLAVVVRAMCAEHGDAGVEVITSPTPVAVDPQKIERIVENLLSNARRHAGPDAGVRVTVVLAGPGGPALLVVEDDGPGVPVELRTTIFEPFEQGPRAEGAPSPGTGIGLTLVAAFAELHGGRARVDTGDLGGARFTIEIPTDHITADRR